MGGNALSKPSVRLNKPDYSAVATFVVSTLKSLYPDARVEPVVAYAEKSTFGDLDVLVSVPTGYDPHVAAKALGALEVVRNGTVTSLGLNANAHTVEGLVFDEADMFQVDLLKSNPEDFDFSYGYFGFNDLGNLVGRVAHKMGLAFRHDGLYFYFREGDYLVDELCLTKNFNEALEFLGYDPLRYAQGFETLLDVFNYTASSKYFNPSLFLLENRNHRSRVRDRKRKTYMEFLTWCETYSGPVFNYPENKSTWLAVVGEAFAHFKPWHASMVAYVEDCRLFKEKFSGALVSQWTGLSGKELGYFMMSFKSQFGESKTALMQALLPVPAPTIKERVLTHYAQWHLDLAENKG